jgi:hypothetical protein
LVKNINAINSKKSLIFNLTFNSIFHLFAIKIKNSI